MVISSSVPVTTAVSPKTRTFMSPIVAEVVWAALISAALGFRLALAVGADGDPIISHYFFECRYIVIFLGVQPGPFRGLQSLRDGDIRIGFGLLGLHSSGNNQTEETDVSDESLWHSEVPCKRPVIVRRVPHLFRVLCEKGGDFDSRLGTPNPLKSNRGSQRPTTDNQRLFASVSLPFRAISTPIANGSRSWVPKLCS